MKTFKQWLENNQVATTLSGWLSTSGKFYACKRFAFDHLGVIEATPEIMKSMPEWFVEKINKLSARMNSGEQMSDHEYDMLVPNGIERDIYGQMYKKGYLRVAQDQDIVYFEGTSQGILNLHNKAKDMAEQYGKKAYFTRIIPQDEI